MCVLKCRLVSVSVALWSVCPRSDPCPDHVWCVDLVELLVGLCPKVSAVFVPWPLSVRLCGYQAGRGRGDTVVIVLVRRLLYACDTVTTPYGEGISGWDPFMMSMHQWVWSFLCVLEIFRRFCDMFWTPHIVQHRPCICISMIHWMLMVWLLPLVTELGTVFTH